MVLGVRRNGQAGNRGLLSRGPRLPGVRDNRTPHDNDRAEYLTQDAHGAYPRAAGMEQLMIPVQSDMKVSTPVSVQMPALRWFMVLGALDTMLGTEEGTYLADFLNEILTALVNADKADQEMQTR